MRIRTSLPLDVVRARLEDCVRPRRLYIPFVQRPQDGLVGRLRGDVLTLHSLDGDLRLRTIRLSLAAQSLGSELHVLTHPAAFRFKKWLPATIAAGLLAILTYLAFTFQPRGSELFALYLGLAAFLVPVLVACVHYARRLPEPLPTPASELAELARVIEGTFVPSVTPD